MNVLIVDDHPIFRNGLRYLLRKIDGVNVVGEASNVMDLLELLNTVHADLVFLDINMPVHNGIDSVARALTKFPNIKIIALSTYEDLETMNKTIYMGLEGYMLKSATSKEIRDAIARIECGGSYLTPKVLAILQRNLNLLSIIRSHSEIPILTLQEREVLDSICMGESNSVIADKLAISKRTVENLKDELMQKTQTTNTINLIIFAFNHRIIKPTYLE